MKHNSPLFRTSSLSKIQQKHTKIKIKIEVKNIEKKRDKRRRIFLLTSSLVLPIVILK
jgi:hypothetical protein